MTKFAIQRTTDQQFWGGTFPTFETWVSDPLVARLFESMTDANFTAVVECLEPLPNWTAVPIAVPELRTETRAGHHAPTVIAEALREQTDQRTTVSREAATLETL